MGRPKGLPLQSTWASVIWLALFFVPALSEVHVPYNTSIIPTSLPYPGGELVRTVVARERIKGGDNFLSIPFSEVLSTINFRSDRELCSHVLPLLLSIEDGADFLMLLVLVLREIKRGTPYGILLDETDLSSMPVMLSEEEVVERWRDEGEQVLGKVLARRLEILKEVDIVYEIMGEAISRGLGGFDISLGDIRKSYVLVMSRNFGLEHTLPPLKEAGTRRIMAIWSDLMNHGSSPGSVNCEMEKSVWSCRTAREVQKGEEILYHYGGDDYMPRHKWIVEYGFVPTGTGGVGGGGKRREEEEEKEEEGDKEKRRKSEL